MLTFEVVPGRSVGPFLLGSCIGEVVRFLRNESIRFKEIDFIFDPSNPLDGLYHIHLKRDGLILRFDPFLQVLVAVDVVDLALCQLSFHGSLFSSGASSFSTPATLASTYQLFGPTFPGRYEDVHGDKSSTNVLYRLEYPGMELRYIMARRFVEDLLALSDSTEPHKIERIPVELSDGTTPRLYSVSVVRSRHAEKDKDGDGFSSSSQMLLDDIVSYQGPSPEVQSSRNMVIGYCTTTEDQVTHRIVLQTPHSQKSIWCGSASVQDVLTEVGRPDHMWLRKGAQKAVSMRAGGALDTKMMQTHGDFPTTQDHSFGRGPSFLPSSSILSHRWIMRYRKWGLDLVCTASGTSSNRVQRGIFHMNYPMHRSFGQFDTCPFLIVLPVFQRKKPSSHAKPHRPRQDEDPVSQPSVSSSSGASDHGEKKKNRKRRRKGGEGAASGNSGVGVGREEVVSQESSEDDDAKTTTTEDSTPLESPPDLSAQPADYLYVDAHIRWSMLRAQLESKEHGDVHVWGPVVLASTFSDNPFGETRMYGCSLGLLFEVMKNDHIASIVAFSHPHHV